MHRMSAIGIVLCALLICGIQAAMNLDGIRLTLSHPTGSKILIAGVFLIAVGVTWMMSMGKESEA
jgi:Flp pilus assembly protein TadB